MTTNIVHEPNQEWLDNATENAKKIQEAIDKLQKDALEVEKFDFNSFKSRAKEVSYLFKNKILTKIDRDRLWNKYRDSWEKAKKINKDEWKDRKKFSKGLRQVIQNKINEVHTVIDAVGDKASLDNAKKFLDEVYNWLKKQNLKDYDEFKELFQSFDGKDDRLLREDLFACWDKWQKIKDEYHDKRAQLSQKNLDELTEKSNEIRNFATKNDPRKTLDAIKAIQKEMNDTFLIHEHYEGLRKFLNEIWDTAMNRIEKMKTDRQRKHKRWVDRMEERADRSRETIEKNNEVIASLQDEIADLEKEIEGAYSENYKQRARGWIMIKNAKIRDIQRTNEDLEKQIKSVSETQDEE